MCIRYIFSVVLFPIITGIDLPSYVKQCQKSGDINNCLKQNIEAIKPHLLDGIPQLYIPSLNPLKLKDVKIETGQFSFIAHVYNMEGLNNFDVKEIDLNLNECSLKLRVSFPYLQATGKYSMKGRIILLTLEGSGDAFANMTNLEGFISMKGVKELKGGKEFINFKDSELTLKLSPNNYIYFGDLFGTNKELSKTLNDVINQNSIAFLEELDPFIQMVTMATFRRTIRMIFAKNAIDDLFS